MTKPYAQIQEAATPVAKCRAQHRNDRDDGQAIASLFRRA